MNQSGTIVGYFSSRADAESAIDALKDAGFERNHIGFATRSAVGSGATHSGASPTPREHETSTWEKIKEFFGGGAPVEPYAGEVSGQDDREIAPELYGDEDVYESLGSMSISDEQARYFRYRFGSGREGAIVTVASPGRESEAKRILEENGGDVGTPAADFDYSKTQTLPNQQTDEGNIQLYGEVLRVHKDRVNRGEARLRKEVHTTNQTVEVPVTREELVVERTAVGGEQATGTPSFQEQELRVPLSEERASIEKQPVVREDVRVAKKPVTDVEKKTEQVRSEELKVDKNPSRRSA
jgi:uncharacterized protein (TIGR02271 family)